MHLTLSLIGPFSAVLDQKPIPISRAKKNEALLIYLAVEMAIPQNRAVLPSFFFPELTDAVARTNLRQLLIRLRRAIQNDEASPPFLLITEETLQFNPACDYEIDLMCFRSQLQGCEQHKAGRQADCLTCITSVQSAIARYQGALLEGFFIDDSIPFERWLERIREQVQEERKRAYQWLAELYERRGDYALADNYVQRQLELEPWHEEAHQQRMRLLARQGQRSAALAQYKRCRQALREELDVEPGPETIRLLEQIRRATSARPHNLPPLPTKSFVGRFALLADIRSALFASEQRLLTLTGPGGIGKSQLALQIGTQVAHDHLGPFMHGVYFVTFADSDTVAPALSDRISEMACISAIAQALSLRFEGPTPLRQQLLGALRQQECLLILDNCEYLEEQSYTLLQDILQVAQQVQILATSRTRFHSFEEWVIEVDGLGFPPASIHQSDTNLLDKMSESLVNYPAIQLFEQRAQQVDNRFCLDDLSRQEKRSVIQISQLTQGMPLAIELAAAWVRMLTCQQIVQEIQRRLDILSTTAYSYPVRHQSIRAVFTCSWQMLSPLSQNILAGLSIFQGGFDYTAAEQVVGAGLFTLADLVDQSLLHSLPSREHKRYRLHPLLRQFAAEKLTAQQREQYQMQHAQYYGHWIQQKKEQLEGSGVVLALQTIKTDIENVRAGWQWAIDYQQLDTLGQYMHSLYTFYALCGWRHEGQALFKRAVTLKEKVGDPHALPLEQALTFSGLLSRLAGFQYELGELDEAERVMQEGVMLGHLVEEPDDLAFSYKRLGQMAYQRGEYRQAVQFFQFSLQILQEIDAQIDTAHTYMSLGAVVRDQGDYTQAQQLFQQSVEIYRRESYPWGLSHALRLLAMTTYHHRGLQAAERIYQESLALAQQLPARDAEALVLHNWGQIMQQERQYKTAAGLYKKGLTFFQEMDYERGCAICLESLGRLMVETGQTREAKQYLLQGFRTAIARQEIPLLLRIVVHIIQLVIYQFTPQPSEPIDQQPEIMALLELVRSHPGSTPTLRQEVAQLQERLTRLDITVSRSALTQLSFQEIEQVVTALVM